MRLSDIYFKHKNELPSIGFNEKQQEVFDEQEKRYYHNLDLQNACFNDKTILLESFIESEDVALKYQIQGQLYPMIHYRIDKLLKSSFKGVSEDKIIHFFFHCIRLGKLFLPKEKLFPLYKKALIEALYLINEENYLVYNLKKEALYLLFGFKKGDETDKILNTPYANYSSMLSYIKLCDNYTSYPNMRKKRTRFLPFTENAFILERLKSSFRYFFAQTNTEYGTFSFTLSGCLITFLLVMDTHTKEMLFKLHLTPLNQKQVWILGSFYKDFSATESHRLLLNDLYDKYPKIWIDES